MLTLCRVCLLRVLDLSRLKENNEGLSVINSTQGTINLSCYILSNQVTSNLGEP